MAFCFRLRLVGTVISAENRPYYVTDGVQTAKGATLYLEDSYGQTYKVPLSPDISCRTYRQGYVTHAGSAVDIHRIPARQQQQGMSRQNTHFWTVGARTEFRLQDIKQILPSLGRRDPTPWSETISEMFKSYLVDTVRLSDNLAVYRNGLKKHPHLEYRGRSLGIVLDNEVHFFDEDDKNIPWINTDLDEARLKVRP